MTTETAAIVWAVLATGGAVAVHVLMRRECRVLDRMGFGQYSRAEKLAGELAKVTADRQYIRDKCQEWASAYSKMRDMYLEQYQTLRLIRSKRHNAAVKARQAQLAQQRARILAKAGEMVGEPGRKPA